ncbi:PCI domain-containing protein [Haematococcus lacustris]|uniref:PCI domain-containing protein n=1 Tax=Haematococcus lacustris TaxID=44745 RepID=A0A699YLL2_HAELA|nr:PCI domain-containing protein [Haematococcus lacustris]
MNISSQSRWSLLSSRLPARLWPLVRRTIMDDPFIREYIQDLLTKIRTQVLVKLIQPYSRVRIPFIAAKLNITDTDVESLLVTLILDKRVTGHIDQVNQLLEVGERDDSSKVKYAALGKWSAQLKTINNGVINRLQ